MAKSRRAREEFRSAACVFEGFESDSLHERSLQEGVMGASSAHAGDVGVMLMDGSARFVRDSIDLSLRRAPATRAGGEPTAPLD